MAQFCKVIVPVRRVQFFMPHSVHVHDEWLLLLKYLTMTRAQELTAANQALFSVFNLNVLKHSDVLKSFDTVV